MDSRYRWEIEIGWKAIWHHNIGECASDVSQRDNEPQRYSGQRQTNGCEYIRSRKKERKGEREGAMRHRLIKLSLVARR